MVIGPPGELAFGFLDTGNLGKALSLMGIDLGSPQSVLTMTIQLSLDFFLFYIIRYIRTSFRDLEPNVTPLLAKGPEKYNRAVTRVSALKPSLLLGLGFASIALLSILRNPQIFERFGPGVLVWFVVQSIIIFWADGVAIWVCLSAVWGVFEIGKEELNLKPRSVDNLMGLGPLGQLSLKIYVIYFVGVGLNVASILLEPGFVPAETVVLVTLLGVSGSAVFFLPLTSIHSVMVREKKRTLEAIRMKYWAKLEEPPPGAGLSGDLTLRDLEKELSEMRATIALDAAERRAAAIPTWPVNTNVLARLTAAPSSIILAIVIKFIIDHILFI